jgi:PAS domain S-box-containing protein
MSLTGSRLPSRWFVRPVLLATAAFLMLLVAIGALGIRYWHERQVASEGVEHSGQVIDALERVRTHISDIETEKRSYLLTRDPSHLAPYGASDESVRGEIEALQALVSDDQLQSLRAAHLALIVAAKLRPLDDLVDTANAAGMDAALALLRGMDEIQVQIDQMLDVERFLLARWQARVDTLQQSTIWLIAAAVVVAIIFAAGAFALARREVTRRRRATEENIRLYGDLEKREAKIRRLVDSSIIGIMIADLGGRIIEANDAFLKMMGYSREDLVSGRMRWDEITPAEWLPVSQEAMLQIRTTGSSVPFEKEYFRKDGSRVPVLVGATVVERGQEDVIAFVLDLTERKQAEGRQKLLLDERKRAEYLSGQVFESSPDAVSIVGRDYRYQRVNPTCARNWGMAAEKIVGMHVADMAGSDVFEQVKPNLDRCFAGEEVSYSGWFTLASGRRYVATTHTPMRPDTERVEAALIISRDLTEHVLASEALREAQMELAHVNRVTTMGQLTASIAHEVNQPIAATLANAEAALRWLGAQPADLEEARQALGRIVKDGKRAGDIIGRIRAHIRKVPPQTDRLDINETILEVVALTRSELLRNGVSLQTELADVPLIQGDRIQLQQVILNLIVNAIQAMGEVGEGSRALSISTGMDASGNLLVGVRDSGPGLNPESRGRLFDAFYTTKAAGMGMGLSICRSIIEAHGGRVWAAANVPQGAVFQFTLPLQRESELS